MKLISKVLINLRTQLVAIYVKFLLRRKHHYTKESRKTRITLVPMLRMPVVIAVAQIWTLLFKILQKNIPRTQYL